MTFCDGAVLTVAFCAPILIFLPYLVYLFIKAVSDGE